MTPFNLRRSLAGIEGSPWANAPYVQTSTRDGNVSYSANSGDYRQMESFGDSSARIVTRERGRYLWLTARNMTVSVVGGPGSPLLRDVLTDINATSAMVRFTKDCVEEEMRYVLGKLRELA